MESLKNLFDFMMARKKWWLYPLLIAILLIGILIILGESSAIGSFIYTLF